MPVARESSRNSLSQMFLREESEELPMIATSSRMQNLIRIGKKYARFIGPGLMVSVSYMDPGNYSTAVAAGSAHKYKLLFSMFVSNLMAGFLQCLCARLGAVTGLDLAQNCKKHLPYGLNITLYILAEIAIIATDLAEVVGTAISLNILLGIPLPIGVVLTVIDVLIVLMAYKPNGDLKLIRYFELFVSFLVICTVICFAIELFYVKLGPASDIFKGFLPSKAVIEGDGLYLSLAILGATAMPHSLYLGSGVVQPRLRDYDIKHGYYSPDELDIDNNHQDYKPSLESVQETLHYTVAELLVSLFTIALFVNCAILIVSGATLFETPQDADIADLFSIYELLSNTLSKSAGTIFALALLFSGQSAGIVCTLSGQIVSEGFLNWTIAPALRRSLTRAVAITPCLILVMVSGRSGLSNSLYASQVVLSVLLPFVSAPLLYFTSNKNIMRIEMIDRKLPATSIFSTPGNLEQNKKKYGKVRLDEDEEEVIPLQDMETETETDQSQHQDQNIEYKDMSNSTFVNILAVTVWLLISGLNLYMLKNLDK
ncbi:Natural resistance-associated macrophage protein [Nakaseomyces glabratus]|nr:Natural resistance-associated macrophage protein [Nakaseomyces glabratus]